MDPIKQKRFDEQGDRFFYEMKEGDNHMMTKTAGLFDGHLKDKNVKLIGMQSHFHAPSEHAIDGQLMDMEMHVVHKIEDGLEGGSQFTNGVLGFLFRVIPDADFKIIDDYHDKFLQKMVKDTKESGSVPDEIDLTEFVDKLNHDRRWTYQGSLTTAPFGEGILWNVVEQVIPIRQATLDMFTDYQKVEAEQIVNKFDSVSERN